MTVKELKEALNSFPDNCVVVIPLPEPPWHTVCKNVSQGFNELDTVVYLDCYDDDD